MKNMKKAVFAALVVIPSSLSGQQAVIYNMSFDNAVHHEAQIEVTFPNVTSNVLEVRMSRSSPGRYAIHEFAKNIYSVTATDSRGRPLDVYRPDPYQWNVSGHDGTVVFKYTLFADRAGGTYSGIDATHAHLNIPATFAWARGMEERPIRAVFNIPENSGWRPATQLVQTGDEPITLEAPDLYYFMDSPIELSDYSLREWQVGDQTIRLAVHHAGSEDDVDQYAEWAEAVVEQEIAVYGELPRFDYGTYTFIADYLPHVNGDGMEHRNSTILSSTASLAAAGRGLLGTLSHEFFHAWNVERIRPQALEPFDFERANMSRELWFAEGFTSYYDDLAIRRAGIMTDAQYAQQLAGRINAVLFSPGREFFTAVEMSMQAPFVDAATSIDPHNRANTFISYYTWGAAIGLGLDLTIRSNYPGHTLDEVMAAVWRRFGVPEIPYTVDDLQLVLGDVVGDADFAEDFFDRFIRGHEAVDYERLLSHAGFLLKPRNPGSAYLGAVNFSERNGTVAISSSTLIGSPLYEAGLDRGDVISSINGQSITSRDQIVDLVGRLSVGDRVDMDVEQRGSELSVLVTLVEDPRFVVVAAEEDGIRLTPERVRFREDWLGGK